MSVDAVTDTERTAIMDSGSHSLRSFGRNDEVGVPHDELSVPRNNDGPVFGAPWEAEAFALAVSLKERGLFTWSEWAAILGDEIKKAQAAGDPDTGETYYLHWLAALERIVAEKGVVERSALTRTRDAWEHACARTPHGAPIELQPEDFA